MKKLFSVFLFMLICTTMLAQSSGHIEYMGIPIDGTITEFQSKLLAKGCTLDKDKSSRSKKGIRVFNGTFIGEKATVMVTYNPSTKIVFGIFIVIPNLSEEKVKGDYYSAKSLFSKKYKDCEFSQEEDEKSKLSFSVFPQQNDSSEGEDIIGAITVCVEEEQDALSYSQRYRLRVYYIDSKNYDKFEKKLIDDI